MEYVVQTINPGKKSGRFKSFRQRKIAEQYAREQVRKGKGIALDRIQRNGQVPLIQRNLKVTSIPKKHDKSLNNFGNYKYKENVRKTNRVRKRTSKRLTNNKNIFSMWSW